jgi:predicted metal-binding protein
MAQNDHPFKEAGRRLKAALISYQLGKKGVDSTLKSAPENPGEGWAELAEQLIMDMLTQLDAKRRGNGTSQITSNTGDHLLNVIKHVQMACLGNEVLHLSNCFTGASRQAGIVTCFVTCPDEIAKEMHQELDLTVKEVFGKYHLTVDSNPRKQ